MNNRSMILLGAQTREVLTELLDMPNVEIDALAARGIV
jgi:hypothetical protein